MTEIKGLIADLYDRRLTPGRITIADGRITAIEKLAESDVPAQYILPGLIDAHVHIESSMLVPSEFARLAIRHGTVATVSDPHEIANVCGIEGVEYMIRNGETVPFNFYFGAPSCVPATTFETAGATLDLEAICRLLDRDDIRYLAEMMNWPAVLASDPLVMDKIRAAELRGKPIDGHAPGLRGADAEKYVSAGISTDHECVSFAEAQEKLRLGMKIAIREGSAARNFNELIPLLPDWPGMIMLCSDDKHPDELLQGHINGLIARGLAMGYDLFDLLNAASRTPVEHYELPVGLLRVGDTADLMVVESLEEMVPIQTWIRGECLYDRGEIRFSSAEVAPINRFASRPVPPESFRVGDPGGELPVILARDGEIVTGGEMKMLTATKGEILADPVNNLLKITVVNRYQEAAPAVGFIRNFGFLSGAIASSVAHDSHNIVAVGCSDEAISRVVNLIMEHKGGIAAVGPSGEEVLPLPVGGIMTGRPGEEVAEAYERLNRFAKELGSPLHAPFMLLSFMALLVIPSYKISDKGMFDGAKFQFLP